MELDRDGIRWFPRQKIGVDTEREHAAESRTNHYLQAEPWITIPLKKRKKERKKSINQSIMPSVWSKVGTPKGHLKIKRMPPKEELEA